MLKLILIFIIALQLILADLVPCDYCSNNPVLRLSCVAPETILCGTCGITVEKWNSYHRIEFGCSEMPAAKEEIIKTHKNGIEYQHFLNKKSDPTLNVICHTPYCTREAVTNLAEVYEDMNRNLTIEMCPHRCPGHCDKNKQCHLTILCIGFYQCHEPFITAALYFTSIAVLIIIFCYIFKFIIKKFGSPLRQIPASELQPVCFDKYVPPWFTSTPKLAIIDNATKSQPINKKVTFKNDSIPIIPVDAKTFNNVISKTTTLSQGKFQHSVTPKNTTNLEKNKINTVADIKENNELPPVKKTSKLIDLNVVQQKYPKPVLPYFNARPFAYTTSRSVTETEVSTTNSKISF